MSKRLLLILIGLSLLSGCGFKLRGSVEISTTLSTISIQGGERELVERLTRTLEANDITVVDVGPEWPTLFLLRSEFHRSAGVIDADGIATEYDYTYQVEFRLSDADGTTLLPQSTISERRTLEYDAGNELEVEREEEFLKAEMENEIILKIMRQLSRV